MGKSLGVTNNEDEEKFNSPWNIAIDFNVDMSFSPREISTMLEDYSKHNNITMNIKELSEEIYFYYRGISLFSK